ncbi:probable LRR receptor-like serine/threonine-protein kinase At5g37450 isoform X3 [Durio zibethinus]|uniref:non-specific serine/threonine protein kinase n=1 Tax=Durio zibethinus TaxID=66656 RepID=A0A6P5Y5J3_DURZI|nr:probable LRR receptor-like serine/threonine-protein kinase At5g37450 isoform X3 [Durio zibethinus]
MAKAILSIVLIAVSCCFALLASGQLTYPSEVDALNGIWRKLQDPMKNLRNWTKRDPCVSKWTGVICTYQDDGYWHVHELRMLKLNLSGDLAPEIGQLPNLTILNFMGNNITGSVPKEIGNIKSLKFLLLSGNQLSGSLADELGYLPKLVVFQVDLNQISGSLPKSFANLAKCKHFHMNNNSISGQIPPELFTMPQLEHFLLDNNNLSGYLPPEFSQMPNLKILQLDNNNFGGTEIPASYGNMPNLLKLSLRNCSLHGAIPDFSSITTFRYLDLSHNQLTGGIPMNKLSDNITTIDLSYNLLNGSIPSNFSGLPHLQRLSLENNSLSGDVPFTIWRNVNFTAKARLIIMVDESLDLPGPLCTCFTCRDFRSNSLSNFSGRIDPPSNVTIRLQGNPVCTLANQLNIAQFCRITLGNDDFVSGNGSSSNYNDSCLPQSCPLGDNYDYVPESPDPCFCAAPLGVTLRLKSPTISDFRPYIYSYKMFITSNLSLDLYQLFVESFIWQTGPRLLLYLKFFPQYQYSNKTHKFNDTEVQQIEDMIATLSIPPDDIFGSYELLSFTLGLYSNVYPQSSKSGISKGAIIGIILGVMSLVGVISSTVTVLFYIWSTKSGHDISKKESSKSTFAKIPIGTDSVKDFSFGELEAATTGFNDTTQVGQGGYGKVYRGILANGTVVAIKRGQQGSLQGQIEFITEIELLSRVHHRNLVSLVGYCIEQGEQMLVYEFMPNGSLHDLLSDGCRHTLSFPMRLHIALGSAKGILYLHTEADPPIIHRDIKANNILLDFKFTPKVSDFGISRLAPVPDTEGAAAHVSTVVKGTPGYLDPEYFLTHTLTEKSDVYSLGIVFLELLTGMPPISHGRNIVREVYGACQSGLMFSIIDRSMGSYSSEIIKKFMALALKCCQDDPKERPTMLEVVRELENLCSLLPESDMIPTESDASISEVSGVGSSHLYFGKNSHPQMTTEIIGSELVSGVIPTIKPR